MIRVLLLATAVAVFVLSPLPLSPPDLIATLETPSRWLSGFVILRGLSEFGQEHGGWHWYSLTAYTAYEAWVQGWG